MTFSQAVHRTPSVQGHLQPGIQALSKVDRQRIACDGRRLRGSVAIDAVLRRLFPNDARWDYAVGVRKAGTDHVIWIEVHPASSHHVAQVIDKARWLRQWLVTSAPALHQLPGRLCWIATGTVSFNRANPQAKRLAEMGLRFPEKHADLEAVIGR